MPKILKLKLKDPAMVRQRLNKFVPAQVVEKVEHFDYFREKEKRNSFKILLRSGEEHFLIKGKTSRGKFDYRYQKISNVNMVSNELRSKCKFMHSADRNVVEYILKDVKIKFCTVEGTGTFLEAMADSMDEKHLMDFMKNFGLEEDDLEKLQSDYVVLKHKGKDVSA